MTKTGKTPFKSASNEHTLNLIGLILGVYQLQFSGLSRSLTFKKSGLSVPILADKDFLNKQYCQIYKVPTYLQYPNLISLKKH